MKFEKGSQIFLPITLNITGKRILIIGGGKVAAHKLSALKKFTDKITILAPEIIDEIKADTMLELKWKSYERDDLKQFHLVYACTNNREINALIKKEASEFGILVNVADDPELCDFISPAICKNKNITIAVGSNAQDVKRAVEIRDRIKIQFDNGEFGQTKQG